jgi:hypothetical protein
MREKMERRSTIRNNPQWEGVIEDEEVRLKVEGNLGAVGRILGIMMGKEKEIEGRWVEMLWKLVGAPDGCVHRCCGELLMRMTGIVPYIGEKLLSLAK